MDFFRCLNQKARCRSHLYQDSKHQVASSSFNARVIASKGHSHVDGSMSHWESILMR